MIINDMYIIAVKEDKETATNTPITLLGTVTTCESKMMCYPIFSTIVLQFNV